MRQAGLTNPTHQNRIAEGLQELGFSAPEWVLYLFPESIYMRMVSWGGAWKGGTLVAGQVAHS